MRYESIQEYSYLIWFVYQNALGVRISEYSYLFSNLD